MKRLAAPGAVLMSALLLCAPAGAAQQATVTVSIAAATQAVFTFNSSPFGAAAGGGLKLTVSGDTVTIVPRRHGPAGYLPARFTFGITSMSACLNGATQSSATRSVPLPLTRVTGIKICARGGAARPRR
jgi:hypothetical protein